VTEVYTLLLARLNLPLCAFLLMACLAQRLVISCVGLLIFCVGSGEALWVAMNFVRPRLYFDINSSVLIKRYISVSPRLQLYYYIIAIFSNMTAFLSLYGRATTMRLLVSHHPPAPNFFQQHVASLFLYLHEISIVLQNLVLLAC